MKYHNSEQKAKKLIAHLIENVSSKETQEENIVEAVRIFNEHAIHIESKTHEELITLVEEHL
jgi:hypothetical protein